MAPTINPFGKSSDTLTAENALKRAWPLTAMGLILGLAILALIIGAAFKIGGRPAVNLLIATIGLLLGHGLGILLSPFQEEQAEFSGARRLLWVFVSGYLLAKLDTVISIAGTRIEAERVDMLANRSLLFLCAFVDGAFFVFGVRRYFGDFWLLVLRSAHSEATSAVQPAIALEPADEKGPTVPRDVS